MPAQVKKCSDCKKLLPVNNFTKCKTNKDRLDYQCKGCKILRGKEWRRKNPHLMVKRYRKNSDPIKKANKKYRKNNKEKIFEQKAKYYAYQKNNPEFVDIPQKWYFDKLKNGAERRGHKFSLTYDELVKSFNGGICELSGRKIYLTKTATQSSGNQNASLDRIDSSKGYEVGNVQWVDWEINRIKSNLLQEVFIEVCKDVANYVK